MYLVDTSVWIELFRKSSKKAFRNAIDTEDAVICLPVVQEVLQGFRDERAYLIAREAMLSLPIVESPMSSDIYLEACDLYRSARRTGLTIRSGIDCLIAVCAIRHNLTVLHHDRDFKALAKISSLSVRAL